MSKRQDKIRNWLQTAKKEGISQAFIARKLSMTPQNLTYHLTEAAELDLDLYNDIIKELKKYIFIEDEPETEEINIGGSNTINKTNKMERNEFPIMGYVPAGHADIKELIDPDYSDLDFDPREHFWLIIDSEYGSSMMPFLKEGDMVLCSFTIKPREGDLVAVRWDGTKGALKVYREKGKGKDKIIILQSYNASEETIILKPEEINQIYKVVNIKKR